MKVLYTTGEALYIAENGKSREIPCRRVQQYKETVQRIHDNKSWKTTGRGAQFMGIHAEPEEAAEAQFCGLARYGEEFLYTLRLDASGGLYKRELTEKSVLDGHICSGSDMRLGAVSCHGEDVALCTHYPDGRSHIALLHMPKSYYNEITEGNSAERSPSWSADGRDLYFSTSGIGHTASGPVYSPASVAVYHVHAQCMETVLEDERYDYLSPVCAENGDLYVIRQPYLPENSSASFGQVLLDVLLFPVRIVQAIGGWLNFFSIRYGGQPLNSDGLSGNAKSRQRSQEDLFFEGNLIRAQKNLKDNRRSGELHPGILPRSRVLLCIHADETQEILAKGVLDYSLCKDGVVYSNGTHVLHRREKGTTEVLAKAELASKLVPIEE